MRDTADATNYQTRYDGETWCNDITDAFPHPRETLYHIKIAKFFNYLIKIRNKVQQQALLKEHFLRHHPFFLFLFVGVGGLQIKARHGAHVRWVYEGEIFSPSLLMQ